MTTVSQRLKNEFKQLVDGEISIKNLFTGHGIFHSGIMFALHQNDSIFLRAEDELVPYLESLGAVAYSIDPNNTNKLALHRYYQLPHSIRKNKPLFEKTVKLSIQQAKFKKVAEDLTKKERIKELANFSIKHERLLAKINIYTVSEFQKIGAIHSYVRLKKLGVSANVELLWTLCAALKNKHASLLTEKEKSAILTKLNVLLAANGLRKVKA
ncbi:TfoX/Sxy family DNA transformation protein [Aggregatibacter actinomycetemcomitans]|uniref:TfoX/Sxy family DNA transformation protein n=1 Tax=Aggregatibacter actinomycetemcomitans TaxID=714 RepID=UPI0001B9F5F3|nr:TfoX/Sxy family DNA transformation protein [Aggregatibacter actinomycetemcomitans]ACX81632.1 DNA transformation protein [Aggregatibacter actinomycetemcomitans D11S-1]AHN71118.1 DNA transformation protein TfoX, putative [Aggregatibacter actinomycetemcomitans HK1651]ANU81585.1 DNA transformation protein [Aggregatibacter actinomycetemcomitans]KND82282.1 DNA transformation protein [Aggregatibacter actinomycetemcomitans serotype b str. SCC1398]KOE52694.1 DNA transformation protein [Aggregatibact